MESITAWLIFALWLQAAGIWVPSILQVLWWRFNSWAYLASWIANLAASWLVVFVLPALGVLPRLPDWASFWLLAALVALVYVPVCFLTRPDDMDHLVRYYVQARPAGFWGPVRREAIRRGLVPEVESHRRHGLFQRDWTAEEADMWTAHDAVAAVLSAACYVLVALGVAGTLLARAWGYAALAGAAACGGIMFRIIDPKLRALSRSFEVAQAGYLAELDRKTRWQGAE
jgi:hypothetical protein